MIKPFIKIEYTDMSSPRYLRAMRFANTISTMLRDFLPPGREFQRQVFDRLAEIGWSGNIELLNVPPQCDALDKQRLELEMIESRMVPIVVPGLGDTTVIHRDGSFTGPAPLTKGIDLGGHY